MYLPIVTIHSCLDLRFCIIVHLASNCQWLEGMYVCPCKKMYTSCSDPCSLIKAPGAQCSILREKIDLHKATPSLLPFYASSCPLWAAVCRLRSYAHCLNSRLSCAFHWYVTIAMTIFYTIVEFLAKYSRKGHGHHQICPGNTVCHCLQPLPAHTLP